MPLCELRFKSASLGKSEALNVILPDGEGPFPVLYLLHGLSDDYSAWARRSGIERYLDGMGLIVVMPDGGRSFYCNHTAGPQYEDHITRDVVGLVDRTFRTIRSPRARAVAGLSMGGYGAMMLALRHPELFSVACSHSGALGFLHLDRPDRPDIMDIARDIPADGRYNLWQLIAGVQQAGTLPAIRFDCGTEDFLLDHNRAFHKHLEELGIPHEYQEARGAHTWDYWDTMIKRTLKFVQAHLQTPEAP